MHAAMSFEDDEAGHLHVFQEQLLSLQCTVERSLCAVNHVQQSEDSLQPGSRRNLYVSPAMPNVHYTR